MTDPVALAQLLGARLAEHARLCVADAPPDEVVRAGDAAVAVLQEFEDQLAAHTGWSNPLRHLGEIPAYVDRGDAPPAIEEADQREVVTAQARYRLVVADPGALHNLVAGRGGDRSTDDAVNVGFLIRQDGWDPGRYPRGVLRVLAVDVEIGTPRTLDRVDSGDSGTATTCTSPMNG